MKKFLLIISFSVLSLFAFCQTTEQSIKIADSLFAIKDYNRAEELYRRILFFSDESQKVNIYQNFAACLFYRNQLPEALFYYNIVTNLTESDSIRNEVIFRKSMIYILQKDYLQAQRELFGIDTTGSNVLTLRYYFYQAIIVFRQERLESAANLFILALPEKSDSVLIREIFINADINGKPNPKTAQLFSIILPGLGQFYSGDFKNAANSFFLNTLLGGVFLYVSLKYGILDAGLSVFPWFQRYYTGGFTRAKQIALKRQQEKKEMLLRELILIFENEKKYLQNN